MPAMDAFRTRWPEVELDIVSGFHADPVGLLHQGRADLAIVSRAVEPTRRAWTTTRCLASRSVALLANSAPAGWPSRSWWQRTLPTRP